MKKIIVIFIMFCFSSFILPVYAVDENNVTAPKWEDYVPEKYQNPRADFTRGSAIAEIAVGSELTALIITSPIGIPMLCHGVTKFKHVSYRDKKAKFEAGLKEAEKIENPADRQAYYEKLLKECKFKEEKKQKLAKKRAKEAEKEAKRIEKENKKLNKEKIEE